VLTGQDGEAASEVGNRQKWAAVQARSPPREVGFSPYPKGFPWFS